MKAPFSQQQIQACVQQFPCGIDQQSIIDWHKNHGDCAGFILEQFRSAISTQRMGDDGEISKLINEAHALMTEPTDDGLHIMRAEFKLGKALSLLNPALTKPETEQDREGLSLGSDQFEKQNNLSAENERQTAAQDNDDLNKWIKDLTDFLYELAHCGGQTGAEAEGLGQGIPRLKSAVNGRRIIDGKTP